MRRVRGALAAMAVLVVSACASGQPVADAPEPAEPAPSAERVESGVVIFENRIPGEGLLFLSDFRAGDASFDTEPVLTEAALTLRPDGCLVALVDGVEHTPVWPVGTLWAGTENVTVEPGDGPSLGVGAGVPGQPFTANAVIGAGPDPAAIDAAELDVVPPVVEAHLHACPADGAPIAVLDIVAVGPGQ